MADARKVNADLVGTAGSNFYFKKTEPIPLLEHAIFGDSRATRAEACTHAGAPPRIARDCTRNPALLLFHVAMNQCQIYLLHFSVVKLCGEALMRTICASDHDRSAGIAIKAVNDAGPQIAVKCWKRAEMVKKSVDESASRVPRSCMNDHTGGLVNDNYICILIQNLDGQFFRFSFEWREISRCYGDAFATSH